MAATSRPSSGTSWSGWSSTSATAGRNLTRARRLPAGTQRWTALRDQIRHRIESEGVDRATGAFTQSFGSTAMDASNLLMPLIRFLPAGDPRVAATVREVQRRLSRNGLVYRYLETDDGLPGGEAA